MKIDSSACNQCGACEGTCPSMAISSDGGRFTIDQDLCVECGSCQDVCPTGAISGKFVSERDKKIEKVTNAIGRSILEQIIPH